MTPDQSGEAEPEGHDLFQWKPPSGLSGIAGLIGPGFSTARARAGFALAIGWLPLLLLVLLAPAHDRAGEVPHFLRDAGTHARFAIALPLLLAAHVEAMGRLGTVVRHFVISGLLSPSAIDRFKRELESLRATVRAPWMALLVPVLAYALIAWLFVTGISTHALPVWALSERGQLSAAGWWHMLVSLPLLLMLLLSWLWRILLWTRLLYKVAGMDLRLIVAHPDNAGGLGFLAQSVRAFAPFAMGIGCITAGRFANIHLQGTTTPLSGSFLIGGTVVLVLLLCVAPLAVFGSVMARAWRRNAMCYGALAVALGRSFEDRWFDGPAKEQPDLLSAPDFSAAADLYGVVANVYEMRFLPVDLRSLLILIAASLAPFPVAMFLSMPTAMVIEELKGLLV
ncbi:hypothetical protein [Novosphingobium guangzhouense]|uniref:Uncharacterized protein n=1 Tax=Novosphingobium guangzhouense TaxID=1850347 RepID=A0A2K2G3W3_9SPHN|nr:hypothetical protein [Novosphingobium guangzhouense]PNU05692.1 hypothetical protein A8V01_15190 [Novosphingobium guangzhouense]